VSDSSYEPRPDDGLVEPLYAGLEGSKAVVPILVHDGDCPWCRAYIGRLIAQGHIAAEQSRVWKELEGADKDVVWQAGIAKGMVAFDPQSGQSLMGEQALLWVLETPGPLRFPFRAMRWPGMGPFMALGYRCVVWLRKKRFPNVPMQP
jgi:hypothetical protein